MSFVGILVDLVLTAQVFVCIFLLFLWYVFLDFYFHIMDYVLQ